MNARLADTRLIRKVGTRVRQPFAVLGELCGREFTLSLKQRYKI
jgi:hypothetical protein